MPSSYAEGAIKSRFKEQANERAWDHRGTDLYTGLLPHICPPLVPMPHIIVLAWDTFGHTLQITTKKFKHFSPFFVRADSLNLGHVSVTSNLLGCN
jgi:hypothetical protein